MAYALFDTPAIHTESPDTKDLAQAGSEMVPPLVIATAQLLQLLDDSSVNIALPSIQDELAVPTPPVFADLPPDAIRHIRWRGPWAVGVDTQRPAGAATATHGHQSIPSARCLAAV